MGQDQGSRETSSAKCDDRRAVAANESGINLSFPASGIRQPVSSILLSRFQYCDQVQMIELAAYD
jgi:hypothetical protein